MKHSHPPITFLKNWQIRVLQPLNKLL